MHPLRKLHELFDSAEPYIAWALLAGGVLGIVATLFGWHPPGWVVGLIAWLLVAREGNKGVDEWLEDEVDV